VAITYTSSDPSETAEKLSAETNTKVQAFKCEITSSAEVDSALEAVEKAYGKKVDIGIACAGIALWKDAHENTDGECAVDEHLARSFAYDDCLSLPLSLIQQPNSRRSSRSTRSVHTTLPGRSFAHGLTNRSRLHQNPAPTCRGGRRGISASRSCSSRAYLGSLP